MPIKPACLGRKIGKSRKEDIASNRPIKLTMFIPTPGQEIIHLGSRLFIRCSPCPAFGACGRCDKIGVCPVNKFKRPTFGRFGSRNKFNCKRRRSRSLWKEPIHGRNTHALKTQNMEICLYNYPYPTFHGTVFLTCIVSVFILKSTQHKFQYKIH